MKYIFRWDPEANRLHVSICDQDGTVVREIPDAVTLDLLCKKLHRTRRHLYRYISKGWLKPLVKFSGEYFFDASDLDQLSNQKSRQTMLPKRLARLFPEYNLEELHPQRDAHVIISRIMERGTSDELSWLNRHFSIKQRRQFLAQDGERTLSRTFQFWDWLLNKKRSATRPSWRSSGHALGGFA